jgi:hypothetical protein
MWGTLLAEQAAKHARAFILVFAPYCRLLFALQQALSRWPMVLWALYTDTCRWRSHIGWQRSWSHFLPLRQHNGNTISSNKHRNTPFHMWYNVIPIGTNSTYCLSQTSHHLSESSDGLCTSVHMWVSSTGLWAVTVCKLVFEILTTVLLNSQVFWDVTLKVQALWTFKMPRTICPVDSIISWKSWAIRATTQIEFHQTYITKILKNEKADRGSYADQAV